MDWTQVLLAALIAAIIAGVSSHALNRSTARATPAAGIDEPSAHASGRHGNWWRGRTGRRFPQLCGERYNERLERLAGYAERELKLTEAQLPAWNDLLTALEDGDRSLAAACERAEQTELKRGAPAEVARIEGIMTAGLQIVQTVRPAFERFYRTLDDDQRRTVDDLIAHGRHR